MFSCLSPQLSCKLVEGRCHVLLTYFTTSAHHSFQHQASPVATIIERKVKKTLGLSVCHPSTHFRNRNNTFQNWMIKCCLYSTNIDQLGKRRRKCLSVNHQGKSVIWVNMTLRNTHPSYEAGCLAWQRSINIIVSSLRAFKRD